MKIIFLGTGTSSGVPMIGCECEVCRSGDPRDKRLRTSVYIETGKARIVIDTGPDFRQQMLENDIKEIDAVLYTHEHRDHTAGLDEVRAFNFRQKKPVDIYCTKQVEKALKNDFGYIFSPHKYPGIPKVDVHRIKAEEVFEAGGQKVLPLPLMHYRLPVLGFKLADAVYITDANEISPEVIKMIGRVKVLVLNALRKEPHISHFSLSQALDIVKMIQPEQAYLTHISHQMGRHAEVEPNLPQNVFLAQDNLEIHI